MKTNNPVIYYVVFNPLRLTTLPEKHRVRATYLNGTTHTWYPEDRGYASALAHANKANKR